MWTMAKVLDGFADLNNERFHTFAIKYNGRVVGQLKWTYRPKNAGGYAWQGMLFESKRSLGGSVVTYYDKNKAKVLEWFKEQGLTYIE